MRKDEFLLYLLPGHAWSEEDSVQATSERNEAVVKEITIKTEGTEVHITSKDVTIQAEEIVLEGEYKDP